MARVKEVLEDSEFLLFKEKRPKNEVCVWDDIEADPEGVEISAKGSANTMQHSTCGRRHVSLVRLIG